MNFVSNYLLLLFSLALVKQSFSQGESTTGLPATDTSGVETTLAPTQSPNNGGAVQTTNVPTTANLPSAATEMSCRDEGENCDEVHLCCPNAIRSYWPNPLACHNVEPYGGRICVCTGILKRRCNQYLYQFNEDWKRYLARVKAAKA